MTTTLKNLAAATALVSGLVAATTAAACDGSRGSARYHRANAVPYYNQVRLGPTRASASLPPASTAPGTPAAAATPSSATNPTVTVGAEMQFSDATLGSEKGSVRLLFGGLALPVEITEWSAAALKIRLPNLQFAGTMNAELEVVRANGTLVSKTAISLIPADTRLANKN